MDKWLIIIWLSLGLLFSPFVSIPGLFLLHRFDVIIFCVEYFITLALLVPLMIYINRIGKRRRAK